MKPKSIFLKVQGDNPLNRIWDFLIVHQEYDHSMKDIAKFSEVGYTTLKALWKDFAKRKIVVQTRTVGKAKMYKLNVKNPVVRAFIDYYWTVISQEIGKNEKKAIKVEESFEETPIPTY